MNLFRVRLDDDVGRALERQKSERYLNVSICVRSLVRSVLAQQLEAAAPVVDPSWNLHLQTLRFAGEVPTSTKMARGSSCQGETGKRPENLVGYSIEITTRRGDSWTATVLDVIERRHSFALVRNSGRPSEAT